MLPVSVVVVVVVLRVVSLVSVKVVLFKAIVGPPGLVVWPLLVIAPVPILWIVRPHTRGSIIVHPAVAGLAVVLLWPVRSTVGHPMFLLLLVPILMLLERIKAWIVSAHLVVVLHLLYVSTVHFVVIRFPV